MLFSPGRAGRALILLICSAAVLRGQAPNASVEEAARRSVLSRIRPGDQIALHFLREAQLNQTVTVTARGEAAFPKLGVLDVGALTIAELQDTLTARYSEYLRSPEFEFSVLRRIVVNGEVRSPNVYLVDPASTLRDVIARAGGLTEYGNVKKVWIVREGERIPATDWATGTTLGAETLHSGDQIYVGRKNWLQLNALSVVSTGVLVASFLISILRN